MPVHPARACASALLLRVAQQGALAQSNVKIYGVADTGLLLTRHDGNAMAKVESGIGATSRLGFTGTEDLGGGLAAAFLFEGTVRTDTGAVGGNTVQGENSFFNRQSNVSLKSREWGELTLGRQIPAQVSPALDTFAGVTGFSPYASLSSIGKDQGAGASIGDSRISRAISYQTPQRFPLGATVLAGTRNSVAPGFPRASAYGAEVHYTNDRLILQAHYMANHTDPTATLASFRNEWWGLGAQYRWDSVTVGYIFNALVPRQAGYPNSQTHALGFTIPYGVHTIRISSVWRAVQGRSDLNSFALGLGYDYALSKRTVLYARAGHVANRRNAIATMAGAALAKPGDDLPVTALGVYTRF
ncbi:MAG TPA: porin [Ramlibacter sp.]|nr:porin [Ramlibacter sp.]